MKAVDLNIKGIKCDGDNCDYKDETVEFKDYGVWLNKPCPRCGSNLLTQKDLDITRILIKLANIINWFAKPFIKPNKNTKKVTVDVEMDGTGRVNFKPRN